MATQKRPSTLRLPDEMYEKVRYLAYLEHRSLNLEIEHAIQAYITAYEELNGVLVIPQVLNKEPES